MNSYNTVNAAYRAAGLKASEGVIHGRDWFEVESFRLDLRAHGRDAAVVGNTVDPFNWENRREGAYNPMLTAGVCDMGVGCEEYGVCYAEAHGEPSRCGMPPAPGTEQVRLPYSRDVAALQELGTRLLGLGGIAAARAGGSA